MPWSNDGKDGGSWKPENPGPWGQPQAPNPVNFEEWVRRAQARLHGWLPGGGLGGRALAVLGLLGVLLWLLFGRLTMALDLGVLRSNSFGIDTQLILTLRRSASRIWSGVIIHCSNSAFRKQAPLKLQPFIRTSEKTVCEKSVSVQSALKKVADDIWQ